VGGGAENSTSVDDVEVARRGPRGEEGIVEMQATVPVCSAREDYGQAHHAAGECCQRVARMVQAEMQVKGGKGQESTATDQTQGAVGRVCAAVQRERVARRNRGPQRIGVLGASRTRLVTHDEASEPSEPRAAGSAQPANRMRRRNPAG
jgi:hypothetical protein